MLVRTARDIGAIIKEARKKRGLSQVELAREIGVQQPKISAIERGAPGVRIGLILQILHTLDVSITVSANPKTQTKTRSEKQEADYVDLDAIADTGINQ